MSKKKKCPRSTWTRYGFHPSLLQSHPDFAEFLLSSPLGSQIKITNNQPVMIDGEPTILIESQPIKFSDFKKRFAYKRCSEYQEPFIVEKESKKIFTYLGAGQGLVPHHPYKSLLNRPIIKLQKEQYQKIYSSAEQFNRKGEYILQIVSCGAKKVMLFSAQHIFLRLIDPNGEVYSLGFGFQKPYRMPYYNHRGVLRSPDIWEYKGSEVKVVTSLLITSNEKNRLLEYIDAHFGNQKDTVFNMFSQNCATFVRKALSFSCNIQIPCQTRFTPRIMGYCLNRVDKALEQIDPYLLKPGFQLLRGLFISSIETTFAFFLSLIGLTLGAGSGIRGQALSDSKKIKKISPPAKGPEWWFDINAKSYDFPHKVRKWQLRQPSTFVFEKNVKFAI
ncbi:MAG: hypothetical protein WDZ28_03110 [Simkaniaceae bacterium]